MLIVFSFGIISTVDMMVIRSLIILWVSRLVNAAKKEFDDDNNESDEDVDCAQ